MKHGISPTTPRNRRFRFLWISRKREPLMVRQYNEETKEFTTVREYEVDPISGQKEPAWCWPKGKTYNAGKNHAKRQRHKHEARERGPAFTPRGTPHGNPTIH